MVDHEWLDRPVSEPTVNWAELVHGLDEVDRKRIAEQALLVEQFRGDDPPPWFGPDGLAQALARLAATASGVLPGPALAAAQEALAGYTELSVGQPGRFDRELTHVWSVLGDCLTALGRHEEALAAAHEEQLAAYRHAAADADDPEDADDPDDYATGEAQGVAARIGRCLARLGRVDEALAVVGGWVEQARPTGRTHLISALYHQAELLDTAGRPDEAITATTAAVEAGRQAVAAEADLYEDQLIRDLNALSKRLTAADRHDDALAAMVELVEVSEAWAEFVPMRRGFAAAGMAVCANRFARSERFAEAVEYGERALAAFQAVPEQNRDRAREASARESLERHRAALDEQAHP